MNDQTETHPEAEPSDVPDEVAMDDGHRPDDIRRRNLWTGLILLLLVALFIAINVYSQLVGW